MLNKSLLNNTAIEYTQNKFKKIKRVIIFIFNYIFTQNLKMYFFYLNGK